MVFTIKTLFSVVTFKVSGNISELGYQIKDGDAAFLDVGTKVYTVKGYQPWFRLAALHFIDGTTFTRPYWAAPDNLFGEIALPKEFQTAIEYAIHPKLVHDVS